jgi:hypothetical protein
MLFVILVLFGFFVGIGICIGWISNLDVKMQIVCLRTMFNILKIFFLDEFASILKIFITGQNDIKELDLSRFLHLDLIQAGCAR